MASKNVSKRVIKSGDVLALTYWVKVDRVDSDSKLLVEDLYTGNKFYVQGQELVDSTLSADSYLNEEKLTKMQAADKLVTLYGKPVTVYFKKENGQQRLLRGKLLSSEPLLGRSYFEDLDLPKTEHRTRLVDHRTLSYFIVDGVKYNVK